MNKICDIKKLKSELRNKKFTLVHGVFDVIHIGHKKHFDIASELNDILVVSITSDKFVKKGPNRPLFTEQQRAEMVSSFENVDYVFINNDETPINLIQEIKPNTYCKGQDYKNINNDITGNIKKEINAVKKNGGKIHFTSEIQFSSSKIINQNLNNNKILTEIKKKSLNIEDFKNQINVFLSKAKKLKVAVIGEVILDEYIHSINLKQPSKENIHAVEKVGKELFLGGSYAIAKNIVEFCKKVDLITAINIDNEIKNKITKDKNLNIRIFNLDKKFPAVKKSRYLNQNFRKLFESYSYNIEKKKFHFNKKISKKLSSLLKKYDCVIMSDFGHGFFSNEFYKNVVSNSSFLSLNVQTNAGNRGFNLATKYKKADYLLLDLPELQLATSDNESSVEVLSEKLLREISLKYVVVTKGKKGIFVRNNRKKKNFSLSAFETQPLDTMGAGDSVLGISSLLIKLNAPENVIAYLSNLFGALSTSIIGHSNYIRETDIKKSLLYSLK